MQKRIIRVAMIVTVLLLIPLVMTLLNKDGPADGWNWGVADFIFAFVLLVGSAFTYELLVMKVNKNSYRLIIGVAVTLALAIVWVEMATGGISRTVKSLIS